MCTSKDDYDNLTAGMTAVDAEHAANKLLVLGTFERAFTFQNDDGTSEEKTTMGLIFSSKRVLERLRVFIESGVPICIQADGTYKLHHGGWVLCDLGVHICRWDSSQRKYVHTFYPLLYMFCRTECYAAYLYFFKTLRCIPEALFGMSDALDVRHRAAASTAPFTSRTRTRRRGPQSSCCSAGPTSRASSRRASSSRRS